MGARIYAGERLRALRERLGLSQRQMANMVGISASYLSQLESDDRPITDAVLASLTKAYPDEWGEFTSVSDRTLLSRALAAATDPLCGPGLDIEIAQRVAKRYPAFMMRLISTHEALQTANQHLRMLDDVLDRRGADPALPWEEVRDWFHVNGNYVDELDRGAEAISDSIDQLSVHSVEALRARLADAHGVMLRLEDLGEGRLIRYYDSERRILRVDGALPIESQRFLIAHQLARLEMGDRIDAVVDRAGLGSSEARKLLSIGLSNYAAGALLMPYSAFRRAAQAVRHDVDTLRSRFGVSFEQVCHRLSTLQRPGAKGVPFYFCRVDLAGNITKRHSATRLQFARYGGACPLWVVHEAVAIPERVLVQLAETPDGTRYVSMAKGIVKPSTSYRQPMRRYAVTLGCEVEHADSLIYAEELDVGSQTAATQVGISCRTCPRVACDQRAFPPTGLKIAFEPDKRGIVPYRFG